MLSLQKLSDASFPGQSHIKLALDLLKVKHQGRDAGLIAGLDGEMDEHNFLIYLKIGVSLLPTVKVVMVEIVPLVE